jgi:hypothetical protein
MTKTYQCTMMNKNWYKFSRYLHKVTNVSESSYEKVVNDIVHTENLTLSADQKCYRFHYLTSYSMTTKVCIREIENSNLNIEII